MFLADLLINNRVDKGRSRQEGGTGLGLAIVKEVVVSHGGDVEIHQTPGGGATVQIALPLAGPAER